ncbi:MAG: hypothetical protein LIO91_03535 [Bacteroidales bacterium]|nr:hypothetical protein [Bacteroidales bacterium]
MKPKQIKRIESELDFLRAKMQEYLFASNYRKASEVMLRIQAKQSELDEAYANAETPRRLTEVADSSVLSQLHVNNLILESILAVDFANDCFCNLREALKRAGFERSDCDEYAEEMESLTRRYTNRYLDDKTVGLTLFVSSNDELIADLHRLVSEYIHQHLGFTES